MILQKLQFVLSRNLSWEQYERTNQVLTGSQKTELIDWLYEDLVALEQKDPASTGKLALLISTSSAYLAILTYRVAHQLVKHGIKDSDQDLERIAFSITEIARNSFGIDINPYATIGHRFVIDHAHGITIGETAVIGDDAYILGGTIIGARGIASNDQTFRHPKIGNNVEIGAYSRLLGPITIGDNVKISPYSIVTHNVAPYSNIKICNQLQLIDDQKFVMEKQSVTTLITDIDEILIHTRDIELVSCFCINENDEKLEYIHCYIKEQRKGFTIVQFRLDYIYEINNLKNVRFHIAGKNNLNGQPTNLTIVYINGFSDFLMNIQKTQGEIYECAI